LPCLLVLQLNVLDNISLSAFSERGNESVHHMMRFAKTKARFIEAESVAEDGAESESRESKVLVLDIWRFIAFVKPNLASMRVVQPSIIL